MTSGIRQITIWALCLPMGLSLYLSGIGGVLCFGAPGHVKVEPAHHQLCGESEAPCFQAASVEPEHHEHDWAGCSDVPLYGPQWFQRSDPVGDQSRCQAVAPLDHSVDGPGISATDRSDSGRCELILDRSSVSVALSVTVLLC